MVLAILKFLTGFFASIMGFMLISEYNKNNKNDNKSNLIIFLVFLILFLIFSILDNSTDHHVNVFMPAPE